MHGREPCQRIMFEPLAADVFMPLWQQVRAAPVVLVHEDGAQVGANTGS